MNFKKMLHKQIILLDGAMGTMLMPKLLKAGQLPELLNITNPQAIIDVHKKYIQAGSQIIYTNTFGANRKKLPPEYPVDKVIGAAIEAAKKATENTNCLMALDMGPIGGLLEPLGDISFQEAYEIYAEQVKCGAEKGVDLIVIETISDLYEMKAAILAAKENSDLPIMATMTFDSNHRTFAGCSIPSMAITLKGLGADAIGINCSLAPNQLLPLVQELLEYTDLPVIVKANAGLPDAKGKFKENIEEFVSAYEKFIEMGVSIIGGCCGTTPEYIKKLAAFCDKKPKERKTPRLRSAVCTPSKYVEIDGIKIIGERLNPTGKPQLKEALINKNFDYLALQAAEQVAAGADILDVNCGLPQIDEAEVMSKAVAFLQSVTDTPLQIDSSNPAAIEKALRIYNGKAIVNSVNGDDETLEAILPIVKKYGAAVIGITLDKSGIPSTQEERIRIAEKIIAKARDYGIPPYDVFIDPLTLTISAQPEQAKVTLSALRYISKVLGYNTVLGISNISFGLPNRNLINASFLTCALENGLTLPIINPNIKENMDVVNAFKALHEMDEGCKNYIERYSSAKPQPLQAEAQKPTLEYCILNGLKTECRNLTIEMLKSNKPLAVVNKYLIPALDKAGQLYESGKLFLPQLILAAETAKHGFDEINKALASSSEAVVKKSKILLATVEGDVHDIGKNIVKVVLENYGYQIVDLGKNVSARKIVEAIKTQDIKLAGLSALMTTTAANMQKAVQKIKESVPDCKVMVGGAVITSNFATQIGADFYGKDANDAVKIAKKVFSDNNQ